MFANPFMLNPDTLRYRELYKKFQAFRHSQPRHHRVLSRPPHGALKEVVGFQTLQYFINQ